jgi:hypothetical protein
MYSRWMYPPNQWRIEHHYRILGNDILTKPDYIWPRRTRSSYGEHDHASLSISICVSWVLSVLSTAISMTTIIASRHWYTWSIRPVCIHADCNHRIILYDGSFQYSFSKPNFFFSLSISCLQQLKLFVLTLGPKLARQKETRRSQPN